jgi:hypothetical protein
MMRLYTTTWQGLFIQFVIQQMGHCLTQWASIPIWGYTVTSELLVRHVWCIVLKCFDTLCVFSSNTHLTYRVLVSICLGHWILSVTPGNNSSQNAILIPSLARHQAHLKSPGPVRQKTTRVHGFGIQYVGGTPPTKSSTFTLFVFFCLHRSWTQLSPPVPIPVSIEDLCSGYLLRIRFSFSSRN